ncbi:hypothetical protein ACHAXR_009724 [Thalassiosira sp. AJA248-18]
MSTNKSPPSSAAAAGAAAATAAPPSSTTAAHEPPPPTKKKQQNQPSLYARKLLQNLSTLQTNASLESRQTIASWMVFNRKKCEGMGEGLLLAIAEAAEKKNNNNNGEEVTSSTTTAAAAAARLMLLLRIIHQVLLSNCPIGSEGDADKWSKSSQLRIRLGEIVIIPLWKALAASFFTTTSITTQEQYQGEIKEMMEEWKEHNVFGGPTVWEEYKKGWSRALKEADDVADTAAATASAADVAAVADANTEGEGSIEMKQQQQQSAPSSSAGVSEDDGTTVLSVSIDDVVTEENNEPLEESNQKETNEAEAVTKEDPLVDGSQNAGGEREEMKDESDSAIETTPTPASTLSVEETGDVNVIRRATKRDSVASVDIEVDFEEVEEAKVEPSQFLDACKVIASIQITRDLGSDAAMNLSSALSNIPSEVEEACNTILMQQQQQKDGQGETTTTIASITELLPNPDSLSKLPDEVLDLDIKYARKSLQSYREAIRQQRKARLQCLQLLLASRCSFGSMDAARSFCGSGGSGGTADNSDNDGGSSAMDMDTVLEKLKKRKEILVDAMALEGLDVEEDEDEKKTMKEEETLKPLSWFPGQVEVVEEEEPSVAKKPKLST